MEEMEDRPQEETDSVDSLVASFSKLLKQLDSDTHPEDSGNTSLKSEDATLKLKNLYTEITEIQGKIEKFRLFKEGQDLYTKWLLLVEENELCQVHGRNDGDRTQQDKLGDLVALSYNNRGFLKYLQVDFKGALEDYTLALKYNPTLPCAYYNRGLVTYRLAFFEQAVQDMKAAVSLDPNRQEFHEGLKKVSEMVESPLGHKFRLPYGDLVKDSKDT